jgi:hypothetical protein
MHFASRLIAETKADTLTYAQELRELTLNRLADWLGVDTAKDPTSMLRCALGEAYDAGYAACRDSVEAWAAERRAAIKPSQIPPRED